MRIGVDDARRRTVSTGTLCSEPSGRAGAAAQFYAFPAGHRQPFWRTSLVLLLVAGLHIVGLLIAFGAVVRPRVPEETLPPLTVRVVDPPVAPTPDEARRIDPPGKVVHAKPAPPSASAKRRALPRPATFLTAATDAPPVMSFFGPPLSAREAETPLVPASAPPRVAARFDADYLRNPKPAYPVASRRLGEEGRVVLHVRVSAEGMPLSVDVKQSSGFQRLDDAARAAVEHWRFVPARQGSETIESSVLVPLQFTLDG